MLALCRRASHYRGGQRELRIPCCFQGPGCTLDSGNARISCPGPEYMWDLGHRDSEHPRVPGIQDPGYTRYLVFTRDPWYYQNVVGHELNPHRRGQVGPFVDCPDEGAPVSASCRASYTRGRKSIHHHTPAAADFAAAGQCRRILFLLLYLELVAKIAGACGTYFS